MPANIIVKSVCADRGHVHILGIFLAFVLIAAVYYVIQRGTDTERRADQAVEMENLKEDLADLKGRFEMLEVRLQLLEKRHE